MDSIEKDVTKCLANVDRNKNEKTYERFNRVHIK